MIIYYQNLVFNAWGRGWNGQRSAENIKRGGAYKVSSIESKSIIRKQIKVKMALVYKIILFVYKIIFQYFYSLLHFSLYTFELRRRNIVFVQYYPNKDVQYYPQQRHVYLL
jgi:hypothetical protein